MNKLKVGERVTVNRKGVKDCGTVRFIGATHFGDGNDEWIGVELDQLDRGNNNGSKDGITYFTCAQKAGVFVRAKAVTRESQRPLLASAATSRISQIRRKHTATDVTSTSSQSLQAHATRSAVKAVKPDHLKPISPPITRTETPAPSSEKLNNGNVEPLKGQQVSNLSENNDIILRILSREIGKEDYFFKVKVSRNCSLETFKIAVHKKAGNPFLEIKHMTYNEDGITFHILDDEDILDAFKATYVVVHWQFTVNIAQKVATSNTSDAPLVEFSKQSNAFMQFQASPRDNSSKSAFDLQKPWYLMLLNDWVCHANSVIHDWFVSYRVAADSDTAKIFVLLLSHKRLDVHPFLDVFCLNFAEPWEQGFLTCLSNSKIFVPILSNQGMESMKNAHKYPDNLLLEVN
ncbi:hypothetical protein HK100_002034 [Physocladia obscura]|uniref:CAP-Gly domain-containing protein n=1 Tax=Physocladia obscura TaxID=109957 RepID=A0AAD5T8M9_9FUNG|nr:hypothetical protein HK100_002034 [Physocladia obscura]